jgi:hypothetical protein
MATYDITSDFVLALVTGSGPGEVNRGGVRERDVIIDDGRF